MINIDLSATYDGMTAIEVMKEFVQPMQKRGVSDTVINELLENQKDCTDKRGEEQ